jgi:threonine/homoserine/homoserine lactone efflux protein
MARLLALNALFFLVPFAAYAGWLFATKRTVRSAEDWPTRTVVILSSIGAVFVLIGLVLLVSFSGTSTNETYYPARVQDGELVPGRFGNE